MPTITSFPERYKLITEQVAEMRLNYPFSRDDFDVEDRVLYAQYEAEGTIRFEWRCYEFYVTLKDGRDFGFHAFTPELLRENMDNEGMSTFICSGLVVVSEITVEVLLDALEQCLEEAPHWGLGHFGYLIEPLQDMGEIALNSDENDKDS